MRDTTSSEVEKIVYARISSNFKIETMNKETIQEKVKLIESKRGFLVELLEKPNLGILRVDVKQALEELDELIEEFDATFPEKT